MRNLSWSDRRAEEVMRAHISYNFIAEKNTQLFGLRIDIERFINYLCTSKFDVFAISTIIPIEVLLIFFKKASRSRFLRFILIFFNHLDFSFAISILVYVITFITAKPVVILVYVFDDFGILSL